MTTSISDMHLLLRDWTAIFRHYDKIKDLTAVQQQVHDLATIIATNAIDEKPLSTPLPHEAYSIVAKLVLRGNFSSPELAEALMPSNLFYEIERMAKAIPDLMTIIHLVRANPGFLDLLDECWDIGRRAHGKIEKLPLTD